MRFTTTIELVGKSAMGFAVPEPGDVDAGPRSQSSRAEPQRLLSHSSTALAVIVLTIEAR